MKLKTRGRTLDLPPMMVRDGRLWDPARQTHYPRIWTQVPVAALTAGALGWFGSQITPVWLAMVVIVGGAFVIGLATSKVRWWIWKRRHPELPVEAWAPIEVQRYVDEKREAARWN